MSNLSKREREVTNELLLGKTNLQIANALFICEQTVKFHLTNVYKKTGVKSRRELLKLSDRHKDGI